MRLTDLLIGTDKIYQEDSSISVSRGKGLANAPLNLRKSLLKSEKRVKRIKERENGQIYEFYLFTF